MGVSLDNRETHDSWLSLSGTKQEIVYTCSLHSKIEPIRVSTTLSIHDKVQASYSVSVPC